MPKVRHATRIVASIAAITAVAAFLAVRLHAPAPAGVERCADCHGASGPDDSHRAAAVVCTACHLGDGGSADPVRAHAGLVRIPGNLADTPRTCGSAGCHGEIVTRVERSIMSTMAGVVAVNRRVLGEPAHPPGSPPHAARLGTSVADSHLRELCVSCHLGQAKSEPGPITETSQGGGCNACHLVYAEATALPRPATPEALAPGRTSHPSFTLNPTNAHCFGCHSRSSRIALSFEGWNELRGKTGAHRDRGALRELADGRLVERIVPDVHHERGLDCIDCHTSAELMGSGKVVERKFEQQTVACEDCHASTLRSVASGSLGRESAMLLALRRWAVAPDERVGATRSGDVLVNVRVDADGRGRLLRKRTGESRPLAPPSPACTAPSHERLSCGSCHTAWAPRCTTCHTSFDPSDEGFDHAAQAWVKGTWNETSGPFEAVPPTLGVRAARDAAGATRDVVETFVPGMILTFDRNRDAGKPPDVIFRRLYARIEPHTTRRQPRTCGSCHADPVALGYGAGVLRYRVSGGTGEWRFQPREAASRHDGLPADAWIGFLRAGQGMLSTRDDVRPFTVDEQRRILRVGACLTCHADDSRPMRDALADFGATLSKRSERCVLPAWR